jgi:hypothetical protein
VRWVVELTDGDRHYVTADEVGFAAGMLHAWLGVDRDGAPRVVSTWKTINVRTWAQVA